MEEVLLLCSSDFTTVLYSVHWSMVPHWTLIDWFKELWKCVHRFRTQTGETLPGAYKKDVIGLYSKKHEDLLEVLNEHVCSLRLLKAYSGFPLPNYIFTQRWRSNCSAYTFEYGYMNIHLVNLNMSKQTFTLGNWWKHIALISLVNSYCQTYSCDTTHIGHKIRRSGVWFPVLVIVEVSGKPCIPRVFHTALVHSARISTWYTDPRLDQ